MHLSLTNRFIRFRRSSAVALVVATLILTGALWLSYKNITHSSKGIFVYILDDAYIHMAVAENIVRQGVWAVHGDQFQSASSSLLWPSLIAADFWAQGINDMFPLYFNVMLAFALLWVAYAYLKRLIASTPLLLSVLVALIFSMPMAALVMTGMEHLLHTLLLLLFLIAMKGTLESEDTRYQLGLGIIAPIAVLCRFESLFFILPAAVLLFVQSRRRIAFGIVTLGALPVVLFGMYSVLHGHYFLPSSIIQKVAVPGVDHGVSLLDYLGGKAFRVLFAGGSREVALWLLFGMVAFFVLRVLGRESKSRPWPLNSAILFLSTTLLHCQFANAGWFFRYEAYLVMFGIVVLAHPINEFSMAVFVTWINKNFKRPLSINAIGATLLIVTAIFFTAPLGVRAYQSYSLTGRAARNNYLQQIQMARFINNYYPNATVAANDIGAISFYNDIHLIDLMGLANVEILKLRKDGKFTANQIERICKKEGVQIAMVYPIWFSDNIPSSWTLVGALTYPEDLRVISSESQVYIYATGIEPAAKLAENLHDFSQFLPLPATIKFAPPRTETKTANL
jgi:hypothetical protein